MWIRVSKEYETDGFECMNIDSIEFLFKDIRQKQGTNIYTIDFNLKSGASRYWPFASSLARDKEFERIFDLLNNMGNCI